MSNTAACNPANPWLAQTARIERITAEAPGVDTYDFVLADERAAQNYGFRPGQFNMLYLPGVGEIAISISGDPVATSRLPHTIRQAGNVTQVLARMGVGETIGLRGPFGSSWPLETCEGKDIILVTGGIGLPPLRPAIYEMLADRGRFGTLTLLYGARTPDGLLFTREFSDWESRGLDVELTVDRTDGDWTGHIGVVTHLLERLALPRPEDTVLMTCGPEVMMWYTVQTARARGIPDEHLYISLERNMQCAIAQCGHCQFGPAFVCKDGPVVRFDRMAPFLKVEQL